MAGEGLTFRAIKDIDLVLIVEAVDAAFGQWFWGYVVAAGYEHTKIKVQANRSFKSSHPVVHENEIKSSGNLYCNLIYKVLKLFI